MGDFMDHADNKLDSITKAFINKTFWVGEDNKVYYDDIHRPGKYYELTRFEMDITFRTVKEVIAQIRSFELKNEIPSKNEEKNVMQNVAHLFYYAKISDQHRGKISREIIDFFDFIKEKSEDDLSRMLIDHFIKEQSSGIKTRAFEAQDYMIYCLTMKYVKLDDLNKVHFFAYLPVSEVLSLNSKGYVSDEDLRRIFTFDLKDMTEVPEYMKLAIKYTKLKDTPENKKLCKRLLKLFKGDEVCKLYLDGVFTENELKEAKPSKDSLLKLSADEIVKINNNKNVHSVSSNDLMNMYGYKFSCSDLISFAENGMVDEEKIINILKYKSSSVLEKNEDQENNMIMSLYNGSRLLDLIKNEKINDRFIEIFNEELIDSLSQDEKKNYFEQLKNDVIENSNDSTEFLEKSMLLYKRKLINSDYFDNIEFEDVFQLYADEKISDEDIFDFYNSGLIDINDFVDLYSNEDVLKFFVEGKVSSDVLSILPEEDVYVFLSTSMWNGELDSKRIFDCYVNENIGIEQFRDILNDNKNEDDISDYIDENISEDKIIELYTNFIISDDELGKLNKNGIVSNERYKEIHEMIARDEFFDELKDSKIIYIGGQSENEGAKGKTGLKKNIFSRDVNNSKKLKISSETIKSFYDALGGMKENPVIDGKTPLKGYSIVGLPEYDLVILENFEKHSNATYIMSFQQLLFYKNNNHKANMAFDIGSKSILRSSEKVNFHNHTSGFGKNIVESIKSMSDKAKDRFKDNDYKKIINEYVKDIKQEYEKNR